jgi:hypothetical protein
MTVPISQEFLAQLRPALSHDPEITPPSECPPQAVHGFSVALLRTQERRVQPRGVDEAAQRR